MVNIAVAGGHGDVGRTVVEVLRCASHTVVTLSRKQKHEGPDTVYANYDSVAALQQVLEANRIEVVISCLALYEPSAGSAEVNLVRGASLSRCTKRFIASRWSISIPPGSALPDFSSDTMANLKQSDLEYTVVSNGHFMDYYGFPMLKSHLKQADFLIDIQNRTAVIPGSGNDNIVFTYSFDVARFVEALVTTSQTWPKHSIIIGDVITSNELVQMAEDICGAKFVIHHDSIEKLGSLQVTELPSHVHAYDVIPKPQLQVMLAVIGQWIVQGRFDLPCENSLNRMFPHIRTMSVREMIEGTWA